MLQLSGLSIELGAVDLSAAPHLIGEPVHFTYKIISCLYSVGSMSDFPLKNDEPEEGGAVHSGIPVACAGGDVTVKVKIRTNDFASKPKLDIEVFVGVVHFLLSPQQLHTLTEMCVGLAGSAGMLVVCHLQYVPNCSKLLYCFLRMVILGTGDCQHSQSANTVHEYVSCRSF